MRSTCRATAFGASRSLQLPGFSVSVGEMAAALRRAGGEAAYARIAWQPDPLIQAIVSGWPQALATPRAEALGFGRDSGIDEVVARLYRGRPADAEAARAAEAPRRRIAAEIAPEYARHKLRGTGQRPPREHRTGVL